MIFGSQKPAWASQCLSVADEKATAIQFKSCCALLASKCTNAISVSHTPAAVLHRQLVVPALTATTALSSPLITCYRHNFY